MKLTVLADNTTKIDAYYLGEPGVICCTGRSASRDEFAGNKNSRLSAKAAAKAALSLSLYLLPFTGRYSERCTCKRSMCRGYSENSLRSLM